MKKRIFQTVSWTLTAACMAVIFYLSSQNGDQSRELSDGVRFWLGSPFSIWIIRKAAHFLEFTGLAVLLFTALYSSFGYYRPVLTFILTAAYAASDEFHQLFVEGRACRLFDLFVDCCGAALGIAALWIIISFFTRFKQRKSKKEEL